MTKEPSYRRRLRRGAVESFALGATGVGLLFLMHVMLSRRIGAQAYGTLSYAIALARLLALFSTLGFPTALMRFVSEYTEHDERSLLRGVIRRSHELSLFTCTIVIAALVSISFWATMRLDLVMGLRAGALILPFLVLTELRTRVLRGLYRVKASLIPEKVLFPTLVVLGIFLLGAHDFIGAASVYVGALAVVFLVGSAWLWRALAPLVRGNPPAFRTRFWSTTAIPMLLGRGSQILINVADKLMLGVFADMRAVGLYTAAIRIAKLNTFVLVAINTIAGPMLAAAFHGKRPEEFRAIIRRTTLWATMGALLPFAAMVIFPRQLLDIFGAEFSEGVGLLRLLALGQFINAAAGPVGMTLLMSGRERQYAVIIMTMAGANVIGNLLAIPLWGAVGAAAVTAMTVGVLNLWLFWVVRRIARSVA